MALAHAQRVSAQHFPSLLPLFGCEIVLNNLTAFKMSRLYAAVEAVTVFI